MATLKERTAKGLFWGGLTGGAQQVLNLVFGIFLARLLSTEDYGLVGMLTIFSLVASSLQEGGFIAALNRQPQVEHRDLNAVFWTSSGISLTIYLVLFLCAPWIASFYGESRLVALSRYIFLGFFITSLGIAPRALLFRQMRVREQSLVSLASLLVSGLVGVAMAATGFAYWGIATQTLVYVSLFTAMNFAYARWHPTLPVDLRPVRRMLGFSSKLIATNLVIILNTNLFSVILGRLYSPHVVGNYTQANKWNYMGWSLINNMLSGISQPVFAKTDREPQRQRHIFRRLLRFTAFVSFPLMLGLALVAREFIVILLGEKWLESATLLQWLCVMGAFYPVSSLFSNLLIARGRSTAYLWSNVGLCVAQLAAVVVSSRYGIERMIQTYVVLAIAWVIVWHRLVRADLHLRLWQVVQDVSPYFLLTCVLIGTAHWLTQGVANIYARFAVKVGFTAAAYCGALWLLRSTIFRESVDFVFKHHLKLEEES